MYQFRNLLMAALMASAFTVSAQQPETLVTGYNFVTCQVNPAGKTIGDPTFMAVPSNFSGSGPGSGAADVNAELLWWNGTSFVPYFYYNASDAYNNLGPAIAGWYDGFGNPSPVVWNPGVGAIIYLPNQSGNITFYGTAGSPTSFTWGPGYYIRGSPDPNVNAGLKALPSDIVLGSQNGDAIYVYKNGPPFPFLSPQYYTVYYYDSNQGGWVPNTPPLQLGGAGGLPTTYPYTAVVLGPLQSGMFTRERPAQPRRWQIGRWRPFPEGMPTMESPGPTAITPL